MLQAQGQRGEGPATAFEQLALEVGEDGAHGLTELSPPWLGMERSHDEIVRVLDVAPIERRPPVHRGAKRFMAAPDDAVDSAAARALIERAHASDDPLYVAVLGAPTNVASALIIDPTIAAKLTVVFVAGYPSASPHVDDSFNLLQDRHASNRLLANDVDLIYIPGYQAADTLSVTLPDLERHVAPCGPLGALLHQLYLDNPLAAEPLTPGHSWVMWDLAPIHHWHVDTGSMIEAFRVDRRSIYIDLYQRLRDAT